MSRNTRIVVPPLPSPFLRKFDERVTGLSRGTPVLVFIAPPLVLKMRVEKRSPMSLAASSPDADIPFFLSSFLAYELLVEEAVFRTSPFPNSLPSVGASGRAPRGLDVFFFIVVPRDPFTLLSVHPPPHRERSDITSGTPLHHPMPSCSWFIPWSEGFVPSRTPFLVIFSFPLIFGPFPPALPTFFL